MKKVIDTISAGEDVSTGGDDWLLLTSPLTAALDHHASTAPNFLYVPPMKNPGNLALTLDEREHFAAIPTSERTIVSSPLLRPTHTPIVLIGNAGVGKTSWIKYFLNLIKDREKIRFVYYSEKAEAGRPFLRGISSDERFQRVLFRGIVSELQSICRDLGRTGLAVFNYNLDEIENAEFSSTLAFTDAVNDALKEIYDLGFLLICVIDDMDHFDDELQKVAFEVGEWLSQQPGINVIVPMRTFTYHVLDVDNKFRPRKFYVSAPNLKVLLENRLKYEWDVHPSLSLQEVRGLFERNEISLDVITAGKIKGDLGGLREFHQRIIDTVSENEYLQKALYALHNENMDEICPIISQMIVSKFFADTFRGDIMNDIPSLKQQEKIVTAYLRGPYVHYRGTSVDYPVSDISLISPIGLPPSKIALPAHLLNHLVNCASTGAAVEAQGVCGLFTGFGYSEAEVSAGLKHLWKLRLIYGPTSHSSSDWDVSGLISASQAGDYVVGSFLQEFAFRFFEANADVFEKTLPENKVLSPSKSLVSMAENALMVFDATCISWRNEIDSVVQLSKSNRSVVIDYVGITDPEKVKYGIDWVKKSYDEISGRVSTLSKSRSVSAPDEKNRFRILRENTMGTIKRRIDEGMNKYRELADG